MAKKGTRLYTRRGWIERGPRYTWREGYSATGSNGGALHPWMTKAECRADARRDGLIAVFDDKEPKT